VDAFLLKRRWVVVGVWTLITLAGLALSPRLTFDFNPLHLKDPNVESMATMLDLMRDPLRTPYESELLAPDIKTATEIAAKLK